MNLEMPCDTFLTMRHKLKASGKQGAATTPSFWMRWTSGGLKANLQDGGKHEVRSLHTADDEKERCEFPEPLTTVNVSFHDTNIQVLK